jgi:hypothetical protein
MKKLKAFFRVLGVLALLLVALNLMVSPTAALGTRSSQLAAGPQAVVVPGGPGFVILNGWDFKPQSPTFTWAYANSSTGLMNTTSGVEYFLAPVHLPQGATINQIVLYYYDDDSVNDMTVSLSQYSNMGSNKVLMATVGSSGATTSNTYVTTASITSPIVDNSAYSYGLFLTLPGGGLTVMNAVRIDYAYNTDLALVMK